MEVLWWKHKGMQPLKSEEDGSDGDDDHDRRPLPRFEVKTPSPWVLSLFSTMLVIASLVSFHLRTTPAICYAPIKLAERPYVFADHPELRPFDQNTLDLWRPLGPDKWWSMEWRDDRGNQLVQGIDMLHKLHCLVSVREEFTLLATNEARAAYFNARTAESITRKMHIKHCLDFIRQDILCAADATVEPLGPGYTRSDGLGVEHQCRDWDVVVKYAASNNFFPEQLKGF